MDIEELKKLNSLTVELKKHGMSADDAFKQAESLLKTKEDTTAVVSQPQTALSQDFLLEKKFNLMIDMNNKKFQEAINILQGHISKLSQELANVRNELAEAKHKPRESKAEVSKEKQESFPKQEVHPRQGQFSPADVSIEKMFYFGKK
ncbi:MAG: hypothetical protein HY363_03775 [Candidatus Aenigmarchaeota archaeon]|nr:hypothetical protein [Candidatus Aenigmarchaeota archaeon]